MGDSRQDTARGRMAAVVPLPLGAGRRGVLREAVTRKVINPEFMEPLLRETETIAEGMLTRRLQRVRDEFGPDLADAAAEGCIRALTIHAGGGSDAAALFRRAAEAALVTPLRTASSS